MISIIGHNSGPPLVNVWHRESQGQAAHVLEGEESRNAVIPSPLTDNRWKWQTRFGSLGANKEGDKTSMRLCSRSLIATPTLPRSSCQRISGKN